MINLITNGLNVCMNEAHFKGVAVKVKGYNKTYIIMWAYNFLSCLTGNYYIQNIEWKLRKKTALIPKIELFELNIFGL